MFELLNLQESVLSSAYKVNLKNLLDLWKSAIKQINNNGPSIEPCGTPWDILFIEEDVFSIYTYCNRLVK